MASGRFPASAATVIAALIMIIVTAFGVASVAWRAGAFFIVPAFAGDDAAERAREQAKKEQERQREQAKKEQERQREQAKKEQERQREQAKQQQERQREQAKQERERSKHDQKRQRERQSQSRENSQESAQHDQQSEREHGKQEHGHDRNEDGEHKAGGHETHGNDYDDDYPPRTLVELLNRMAQPKKKKPVSPPATAAKKTRKKARRAGGVVRPFAIPAFASRDILALDFNARKARRARSLGFKVNGTERFPSLGLSVTRLMPPRGLSPVQARVLLRRELRSQTTISLNKAYRVYHAATDAGKSSRARPSASALPWARPNVADHLYGASVIRWRPKLRTCAKPVRVGVIDTSIDHGHSAFKGKRLSVGNFVPEDRPRAANWHGTGVLALLMGDPGSSTPGLISDSEFFAANVFYADKQGYPLTDSISLLKALDWMDVLDVNVINMSVAGPKDPLIQRAIARMAEKGVIFVAAGGNEGPAAPPSYPAAYPQVIAVTAVNQKLRGYRYANRGKYIDLAAPGVDIWTAMPDQKQGFQSGTSFATPYVTSIVAALYGGTSRKTKNGILKRLKVRDLGAPGRDPIYGRGLIVAPATCRPGSPTLARR